MGQPVGTVGTLEMANFGAFVAFMGCAYKATENEPWKKTRESDGIDTQKSKTIDPGQYGVPNGATVSLYAQASAGQTHQAVEEFIYEEGSPNQATYTFTGTTQNLHLHYGGIKVTSQAASA